MPRPSYRLLASSLLAALCLVPTLASRALVVDADPRTYRASLARLAPGDTLRLAPGTYRRGLPLHGVHGRAGAPITVEGPRPGQAPAVLVARPGHNTVSLSDASHLVIRRLVLEGAGMAVDAVKAEGAAGCRAVHHVTLEGLQIRNFSRDRQVVGISTKCSAWGWQIRGNTVRGVGTGIYLGRSDGSAPFVRGLIEDNVVADTTGYCLQIKHQRAQPPAAAVAQLPPGTIIRGNVFRKDGRSAGRPDAPRPNVLLGHQPVRGRVADDVYYVYANTFYGNPREALLQAEGNVALYANAFVNPLPSGFPAIAIQPHHHRPRALWIVHNTVVAPGVGIRVRSPMAGYPRVVAGNAVFAAVPLSGVPGGDNATGPLAVAASRLVAPLAPLEELDLRPLPGALQRPHPPRAPPLPATFPGADRDLRGVPHRAIHYGAIEAPPPPEEKSPGL